MDFEIPVLRGHKAISEINTFYDNYNYVRKLKQQNLADRAFSATADEQREIIQ